MMSFEAKNDAQQSSKKHLASKLAIGNPCDQDWHWWAYAQCLTYLGEKRREEKRFFLPCLLSYLTDIWIRQTLIEPLLPRTMLGCLGCHIACVCMSTRSCFTPVRLVAQASTRTPIAKQRLCPRQEGHGDIWSGGKSICNSTTDHVPSILFQSHANRIVCSSAGASWRNMTAASPL